MNRKKGKIDKTDFKLLAELEKHARVSLKDLANRFNIKTSTIYHRLHKLMESDVLKQFTIVINPEAVGLEYHTVVTVKLKNFIIGRLDEMFLDSFAGYLANEYKESMFVGTGEDRLIYMICSFRNKEHHDSFLESLKKNPYIEEIGSTRLKNIIKGTKLFSFSAAIDRLQELDMDGEKFDDFGEEEEYCDEEKEYSIEF